MMRLRRKARLLASNVRSALGRMGPLDEIFVLSRGGLLAISAVGLLVAQVTTSTIRSPAVFWGTFTVFITSMIYVLVYWRGLTQRIRLAVFTADLVFLFFLVTFTGASTSAFVPMAYLLAALYGLSFGVRKGIIVGLGTALALGWSGCWSQVPQPWHRAVIETAFLVMISTSFGWFGGREELERRRNENLESALWRKDEVLESTSDRLRNTQRELSRAGRLAAIGQMSAEIAHQVRDPLSSLSLNLEMLEEELQKNPVTPSTDVKNLLAAMGRAVDNLADLTENYLQFAQIPPPVLRPESLGEVVRDVLASQKPNLNRAEIVCAEAVTEGLSEILFDRRQIKFVLENLIQTAHEAMPEGGRLRVATGVRNGYVTVTVADTGPGIPPGLHQEIFEPFYTTKRQGTGLGLSLARRVIERHGGRLTLNSIVGVGSTFTVYLPADGGSFHE